MVLQYSPEPERDSEEAFNIIDNSGIIVIDSSEEDEITQGGNEHNEFGYELLPQEIPSESIDNDEVEVENSMDSATSLSLRNDDLVNNYGEVMPMAEECANKTRPDMEINAEEVRAAMRNVSLPPSSFPPWAASIPESQWTQFLFMRLANSMQ